MSQQTDRAIWEHYQRTGSRDRTAAELGVSLWRVRNVMLLGKTGAFLSESPPEPIKAAAIKPTEPEKRPAYELRENGAIIINRVARTVTTDLGEFGEVTFSFGQHAAMLRRYADDWENTRETIPQIARDFDLHPRAFDRYKTLHGWTHASSPFTDLEWEDGLNLDEAVNLTVASQERAFHQKLVKEKERRIYEDADKWRRFNESALKPVLLAVEQQSHLYQPPLLNLARGKRTFDLVCCAPDLHFGKYEEANSYHPQGYGRSLARQLLIERTQSVLADVAMFGRPERIITIIGSDFLHVDNQQGATSNGTPQDVDGTPEEIVREGADLALDHLMMLQSVAPVEILYGGGNHDHLLSYSLLQSVFHCFRNDPRMTVRRSSAPRQYILSGDTLLGFAHGDGAKRKDLAALMAIEASKEWGQSRWRAMFTGHFHHESVVDAQGVTLFQMPSLSSNDRWHTLNGYVGSRRSIAAYIIDSKEGVIATIYAPVLNGSEE